MGFSFLPRNENFFLLFNKQTELAVNAARYFVEITSKGVYDDDVLRNMRNLEHQADEVTHEIIERLNKTFITPFDREDIFTLTKELDSVVDMIYTITNRLKVYKVNEVNQDLLEFSKVIEKSVLALKVAIEGLKDTSNPKRPWIPASRSTGSRTSGTTCATPYLPNCFPRKRIRFISSSGRRSSSSPRRFSISVKTLPTWWSR